MLIIDDNIPYIQGRIDPTVPVTYTDQFGFTPELVHDADALVIRTRTRCDEALLADSSVRLVATATIGTDQIDLPWCTSHGITVRNSPGCNAPGVAQYVWSALLRMGLTPGQHRVGVVGCGNVGGIVAEWGRTLGFDVVVSDPPRQERGIGDNYLPLDTLLATCDAITLHTPLTHDGKHPSYHLIGGSELSLMRRGSILVNAARGPVVEQNALRDALQQGHIRAVIDTWEFEPQTDPEILRLAEYATFHIAGYSRQGKERATRMVLEALEDVLHIRSDRRGLAGAYSPLTDLTAEAIVTSYDPGEDTTSLRQNPTAFDTLRRNYHYRDEVS